MNAELIKRIKMLMAHFELTSNAFAKKVNIDPSNFKKMLDGNQSITRKTIDKIVDAISNLNIHWLKTGEGEMLRHNVDESVVILGKPVPEIKENLVEVKFYEVTPSATFKDYCQGMEENPSLISIVPVLGEKIDDSSCVFEINGESMAPQIQDKAKVLCREISPTRWHTLSDEVVVIAYGDKFVIKRIADNRIDSENYLVLESDNPEMPGREVVQLADIRCIFRAERIISQRIN